MVEYNVKFIGANDVSLKKNTLSMSIPKNAKPSYFANISPLFQIGLTLKSNIDLVLHFVPKTKTLSKVYFGVLGDNFILRY